MSVDKILRALASVPRRKILAYLSGADLSTSQLAERFAMTPPAISRHLSILENAGLVSCQRVGQSVMYALNKEVLANQLNGLAAELCPVARPLKRESKQLASKKKPA
jgi:ArsR family transcriptional regulator